MQHLVLLPFISKELGVLMMPNSYFDCKDYSKVKELEKQGFIKSNEKVASLKVEKKPAPTKRTKKVVDKDVGEN